MADGNVFFYEFFCQLKKGINFLSELTIPTKYAALGNSIILKYKKSKKYQTEATVVSYLKIAI